MKTFIEYLSEASDKNTHLEHIEEEILNDGISGAKRSVAFLRQLLQLLSSSSNRAFNVTVKWDGAPAVICGIDPENNKFFVGTKSVFAKTAPKINYTHQDIKRNYSDSPELASKLKFALDNLSKVGIRGILQGDMLFTNSDLELVTIDGTEYVSFRPNTIRYVVPKSSELATKILSSKIGIVFHTTYTGNKISDLKANFGANISSLKNTTNAWITDADYKDESGTSTLTKSETQSITSQISEIESLVKNIDIAALNSILSDSKILPLIRIYINSKIREGVAISSSKKYASGLLTFITDRFNSDIEKLKTDKGKDNKKAQLESIIDFLKRNNKTLLDIFYIAALISDVKNKFIKKMNSASKIGSFIDTPDGFKATSPEGFVAVDHLGKAVKLVDRLEFSRANFTAPKNWG